MTAVNPLDIMTKPKIYQAFKAFDEDDGGSISV